MLCIEKYIYNYFIFSVITNNIANDENDVTFVSTEVLPNNITNKNNIETGTRITRSRNRGVSNGRGRGRYISYPATRSTRKRVIF